MDDSVDAFAAVDADLRLVATFGSTDYTIEYARDDVADQYSHRVLDRIYQDVVANQVSSGDVGSVSGLGEVRGQVYYFDDILAVQFPASRYEGIFATYDEQPQFPVDEVFTVAQEQRALQ